MKVVEVTGCYECKYMDKWSTCNLMEKGKDKIPEVLEIPDWCPLPDAPKEKNE